MWDREPVGLEEIERVLMEEIRMNPHEAAPRLVYADHLEEKGSARADLIRVQLRLAEMPANDPARLPLEAQEAEILYRHADAWLAPLRACGAVGAGARCFRGGMIERVRLSAVDWLRHAEEICAVEPALRAVQLQDLASPWADLLAMPMPSQIVEFDVTACRLAELDYAAFAAAPWLQQAQVLTLDHNGFRRDQVRAFAQANLSALVELNLGCNQLDADAVDELVQARWLPQLMVLRLNVNPLGDAGVARLSFSPPMRALEVLDLSATRLTNDAAAILMQTPNLPNLRELRLRGNRLDLTGMAWLRQSALGRQLRVLDVRGNRA